VEGEGQVAADAGPEGDKLPQTPGDKMPQTPGPRETKTCLSVQAQASHYIRCVHLATQRTRNQTATADAWEETNKEYRSDEIHCGGGARFGSRGVREIYAASLDGSQLGCDMTI